MKEFFIYRKNNETLKKIIKKKKKTSKTKKITPKNTFFKKIVNLAVFYLKNM